MGKIVHDGVNAIFGDEHRTVNTGQALTMRSLLVGSWIKNTDLPEMHAHWI
jgi:hypothetical protein